MKSRTLILALAACALAVPVLADAPSAPYAGEQARPVKALSDAISALADAAHENPTAAKAAVALVFCDGLMFAMVTNNTLYFRVDDGNRAAFNEAESFPPLNYKKQGEIIDLSFWRAPERLFDETR